MHLRRDAAFGVVRFEAANIDLQQVVGEERTRRLVHGAPRSARAQRVDRKRFDDVRQIPGPTAAEVVIHPMIRAHERDELGREARVRRRPRQLHGRRDRRAVAGTNRFDRAGQRSATRVQPLAGTGRPTLRAYRHISGSRGRAQNVRLHRHLIGMQQAGTTGRCGTCRTEHQHRRESEALHGGMATPCCGG